MIKIQPLIITNHIMMHETKRDDTKMVLKKAAAERKK